MEGLCELRVSHQKKRTFSPFFHIERNTKSLLLLVSELIHETERRITHTPEKKHSLCKLKYVFFTFSEEKDSYGVLQYPEVVYSSTATLQIIMTCFKTTKSYTE